MSGFSQPTPKAASIPAPVDINSVAPDKRSEYQELLRTAKELEAPLDDALPKRVESVFEPSKAAEVDLSTPTADDKKRFLRSILGGKDYDKSYKLFGDSIQLDFVDRSVETTEKMYDQLEADAREKKIKVDTEEQWAVWAERYLMAATLRQYGSPTGVKTKLEIPEAFLARANELMKLPKPLYQAMMEASRVFEQHVQTLTEKAQEPNFWQADGKNSR